MRLIQCPDWRSDEDSPVGGRSMASIIWAICGGLGRLLFFFFLLQIFSTRSLYFYWDYSYGTRLEGDSFYLVGLGLVYCSGCFLLCFFACFYSIVPYYTPLVVSVKPRTHFIFILSIIQANYPSIFQVVTVGPEGNRKYWIHDCSLSGLPDAIGERGGRMDKKRGDPLPSFHPSLPRD